MTTNTVNKIVLPLIAIGIWAIVLQNAGIIPTSQNVEVTNRVRVRGSVDINNTVDVSGYLDVNLEAINGKNNAFYDSNGNENYVRIPIYNGN